MQRLCACALENFQRKMDPEVSMLLFTDVKISSFVSFFFIIPLNRIPHYFIFILHHGVNSPRVYFVTGSIFHKIYKSIDVGPQEEV